MTGTQPLFTRVELKGPPEAVDDLVTGLSEIGEIAFDSRGTPDARGEVACIAEVVTAPRLPASGPGPMRVVMQTAFDVDPAQWPGLSLEEVRARLEEAVTAAVSHAVAGSSGVAARVVSLRPARAPRV
ncbi:hypothetical protein GCM10010425_49090 [Streptomyces spororaveus]|uniref:Uncharacterized protein n=1 Tax=Streptomyces spororaveus TaxID=284039 RepID=A0ABQ3T297_9ACTN|nr:hypothetical protein [Streptomyces spororaveus]GHI74503.1 hypothetical protein Sspor_00640 [Streptomyces spororaveus]